MLKPYVSNMPCLKAFQSLDVFERIKILWKRFILSSSMKETPLKWEQAIISDGFSR